MTKRRVRRKVGGTNKMKFHLTATQRNKIQNHFVSIFNTIGKSVLTKALKDLK